ncbi:NUDIX domain-containing protein [Nonomuraea ferruginea]
MTRREIVAVLTRYLGAHPGRAADAVMLAQALDREQDLASRETLPLHVTTSAVAIDGSGWVLMIRHSAQDRCLLPGGHVEPSDDSLCDAALRELEAGTGVPRREVVVPAETVPVDIEVHEIPADPARGCALAPARRLPLRLPDAACPDHAAGRVPRLARSRRTAHRPPRTRHRGDPVFDTSASRTGRKHE